MIENNIPDFLFCFIYVIYCPLSSEPQNIESANSVYTGLTK